MEIKDLKAFRAAQGCVSTDEMRRGINGVRIELDGSVVATDGHILFKSKEALDASGLDAAITIKPAKLFKLSTTSAKINFEAGLIQTDKEDIRFEVIEEKYPDYAPLIDRADNNEALQAIGLGSTPVIKLFKALESLKEKRQFSKEVTLTFGASPLDAIKITISDRPETLALLMPCRA